MRIIAGEHRGRRLQAPPGRGTRPMLDRVREALFSSLAHDIPEARVLDLFAGTGSLGLEALSRGAERARFVERDGRVQRVLAANVQSLGLSERAQLVRADGLDAAAWRPEAGSARWDLVFLDPPYPLMRDPSTRREVLELVRLLAHEACAPGAPLVLHVPTGELREEDFEAELAPRLREYGSSALWIASAPSGGD